MELENPSRALGETVYVALGNETCRKGKLTGGRSTAFLGNDEQSVEYKVLWGESGEFAWFKAKRVFSTPAEAFE